LNPREKPLHLNIKTASPIITPEKYWSLGWLKGNYAGNHFWHFNITPPGSLL
jgi:hypothetical protein